MLNKNTGETSKRKLEIWLPMLFALTSVVSILVGFQLRNSTMPAHGKATVLPPVGKRASVGKLEEMLRFIETKYVDEVDRDKLVDKAIAGILKDLDPHSGYITAEQLESVNEDLEGSFDGIGVQFYLLNDTILVVSPVTGGPSEAVGIRAGDKIVEIEDSIVAGVHITNPEVMKKLRGKKGSEVRVGILRGSSPEVMEFTITRGKIPNYSVDVGYMIDEKTGLIKISRFSGTTYEEFMKKLEELEEDGLENLIIDLRQNPGGYLMAATKIADQLFDSRKLLVYTEGRTQRKNDYESTGRNFYDINEVIVLLDEGSASASEILAGAVQDWDRGTIVGRRSFGKGLVQEQYELNDGSALRLTVARYYTPTGRCIQKPYDKGKKEYYKDVYNRSKKGEFEHADSIRLTDSTMFRTPKGKIVYGGGGIMPDIFVPIDSIVYNAFFTKSSQYFEAFVFEYHDRHREELATYESFDDFNRKFKGDEAMMDDFLAYVKKKSIPFNARLYNNCASEIKHRLKALFARQLFKEDGFYKVLHRKDEVVEKALQEIYN